MSKLRSPLVNDVLALADSKLSRKQIASRLGITVEKVSQIKNNYRSKRLNTGIAAKLVNQTVKHATIVTEYNISERELIRNHLAYLHQCLGSLLTQFK
jgi:transcriptional regulator with XRE-family HTH domain